MTTHLNKHQIIMIIDEKMRLTVITTGKTFFLEGDRRHLDDLLEDIDSSGFIGSLIIPETLKIIAQVPTRQDLI